MKDYQVIFICCVIYLVIKSVHYLYRKKYPAPFYKVKRRKRWSETQTPWTKHAPTHIYRVLKDDPKDYEAELVRFADNQIVLKIDPEMAQRFSAQLIWLDDPYAILARIAEWGLVKNEDWVKVEFPNGRRSYGDHLPDCKSVVSCGQLRKESTRTRSYDLIPASDKPESETKKVQVEDIQRLSTANLDVVKHFYHDQVDLVERVARSDLEPLEKLFVFMLLHNNIKRFVTPTPDMSDELRKYIEEMASSEDIFDQFEREQAN